MDLMDVQHVGIDAEDYEQALHIGEVIKRAGFKGEVVNRSLEQNDCLHKWCRIIRDHLQENGVKLHEGAVKELILTGLGNTKKVVVKGIKAASDPVFSRFLDLIEGYLDNPDPEVERRIRRGIAHFRGDTKIDVAMRSSQYKQLESDLSVAEQRQGIISMNELLTKVEVWAATDLGLNLAMAENERIKQQSTEDWLHDYDKASKKEGD